MNVLIIGEGGREHALAWKVRQSREHTNLFCIPGNAGIAEIAICRPDIKLYETAKLIDFIKRQQNIELTIVGPDNPLADGIVDALRSGGCRVLGPTKNAAMIESSKVFAKQLMKKYGIPTADFEVFESFEEACSYVEKQSFPLVVKADGLARGKGVIICESADEAKGALKKMMVDKAFGNSGNRVVIEKFLKGKEATLICFTDGKAIIPMASCQDHKRAFDGDQGPNTGGMGAFSPSMSFTDEMLKEAEEKILQPVIDAMQEEGRPFSGILYCGLIITDEGLKVLEFNARFGDPEAQVILPRLKSNFLKICNAIVDGTLEGRKIEWDDSVAVCVMLTSKGYPGSFETGFPIEIGDVDPDVLLFHSGTSKNAYGELVTAGGRVIGVTALAPTIAEAREKAYKNAEKIKFEGKQYRKDIGLNL
jgi:phosphoribosylamine--glycine ligase